MRSKQRRNVVKGSLIITGFEVGSGSSALFETPPLEERVATVLHVGKRSGEGALPWVLLNDQRTAHTPNK